MIPHIITKDLLAVTAANISTDSDPFISSLRSDASLSPSRCGGKASSLSVLFHIVESAQNRVKWWYRREKHQIRAEIERLEEEAEERNDLDSAARDGQKEAIISMKESLKIYSQEEEQSFFTLSDGFVLSVDFLKHCMQTISLFCGTAYQILQNVRTGFSSRLCFSGSIGSS